MALLIGASCCQFCDLVVLACFDAHRRLLRPIPLSVLRQKFYRRAKKNPQCRFRRSSHPKSISLTQSFAEAFPSGAASLVRPLSCYGGAFCRPLAGSDLFCLASAVMSRPCRMELPTLLENRCRSMGHVAAARNMEMRKFDRFKTEKTQLAEESRSRTYPGLANSPTRI